MRARSRRILRFAALALAQAWWFEIVLPRVGLSRLAERGRSERMRRLARRFHALAVSLGGLMIKVGQFMSSRLDVLPPEITAELAGLQDEVPAVPFAELRAFAERELGAPLARVFAEFDETPLAAASLGQAHRAVLGAGDADDCGIRSVVVKMQRPGIDRIVDVDLAALRRVAGWLDRISLVSKRADVPALLEEFATTSLEEIDYLAEAGNAVRFAEQFAGDDRVGAPQIVWQRSGTRVLVLEDVTAIKITDQAALTAAGIDPAKVADTFAAVMFDQLFVHGFFHADPHPGNIFVTLDPATSLGWRLTFIDFGMMGVAPASLRKGLQRLLIAVATRDGARMVEAMRELGVLVRADDTAELKRALAALFERFGGMGFAELQQVDQRELRTFADDFGRVVRRMPFQLPENFLLIVRAMSLTSGVCSALAPRFNIWQSVEPYAERLARDQRGSLLRGAVGEGASLARGALAMPRRLNAALARLESGEVIASLPALERQIDTTGRGLGSAIVFAALFVGGALMQPAAPVLSWLAIGASAVPLVAASVSLLRRRGR